MFIAHETHIQERNFGFVTENTEENTDIDDTMLEVASDTSLEAVTETLDAGNNDNLDDNSGILVDLEQETEKILGKVEEQGEQAEAERRQETETEKEQEQA